MKLPGGKEFRAQALPPLQDGTRCVQLQLLMLGIPVASEVAPVQRVRELAGELLAACASAEGTA